MRCAEPFIASHPLVLAVRASEEHSGRWRKHVFGVKPLTGCGERSPRRDKAD